MTSWESVVPEHAIRFVGHPTHEHPEPHLVFVVTGQALLVADGRDLLLHRHEAAWLAPGVPHAVETRSGGMVLGPLLEPGCSPPERIRALGVVPDLVELLTTVLVAAPSSADHVAPFRSAIGALLRAQALDYFPLVHPRHPVAAAVAREAAATQRTLDQLAAQHRISQRQLLRIFVEETGLPFHQWRVRARLNPAVAHLLIGGGIPAAAMIAGFGTRTGFLRALARETGVPMAELTACPDVALRAGAVPVAS
ncbi:helix-turn-helix domain-containing protein [Citricoccus zhacaiensis]|uniref:helix-turn-helix domain-containing protein n=1 Tax=Citricoccus zhacaiensis TaxID=489142 RepID=UPI001668D8A7|nr:AraC family transcriptional regulator [Citricoccus zhacaiensis]